MTDLPTPSTTDGPQGSSPVRPVPVWGQPPAPDDWRYRTGALSPPPSPTGRSAPGYRATPPLPAPHEASGPPRPTRPSRASLALALSVGGLLACGLLSVVGMVIARADLEAMNRGMTDSAKRSRAEAAFATGILGTVIAVVSIGSWIMLIMVWRGSAGT